MSDAELQRLINDVRRSSDTASFIKYEKLKKYIHENSVQKTHEAWKLQLKYEPIRQGDIEEWEAAINREFTPRRGSDKKTEIYELISQKYPTPHHMNKWIESKSYMASKSDFEYAYKKCKDDFAHGQLLFEKFIRHCSLQRNWEAVRKLYEERLQIPHRQLQETYEAFSTFVSAQFPEDYTEIMRNASKLKQATEKSQRYYELLESAISSNPDSPEPWLNYMQQLFQYSKKESSNPTFLSVFYRSLFSGSRWKFEDPLWLEIWLTTLRFLNECSAGARDIMELIVINYPQSPDALSAAAWSLSSRRDIKSLRLRAVAGGLFNKSKEEHFSLFRDLITLENADDDTYLPDFIPTLEAACETFAYREDFVRICIKILESSFCEAAKLARRKIFDGYLGKDQYCAFKYNTVFDLHERRGCEDEIKAHIDVTEKNLHKFDDPESAFSRIDYYLRGNMTRKTRRSVHQRLQKLTTVLADIKEKRANKELQLAVENPAQLQRASKVRPRVDEDTNVSEFPEHKKIKAEPTEGVQEPVRSREQFRVKLFPLSQSIKQEDITKFLRGYADPLSIQIFENGFQIDDKFAVVELASEQEVLSCLTRQFKRLLDIPVNITRMFGTTVWATNYPSGYDYDDIKKMIIEASDKHPIAIRLPAQRDNKERRFFYADFPDEESANMVRDKLSGLTLQGNTIQAEISNPSLRKPKELAPSSHQIHLHNLNFKKTTEDTLRQNFSSCGEISGVHLPLSDVNKEKGFINNGFAFITFSNDASAAKALAQGKATIDERVVDISAVKPKKSSEKKISGFEDQKTISIKNIDETVTEAQFRKFVEDKVGPASQISLKPSKKMALVEFETVKDAGKAGVVLEGILYEGYNLTVGLKKEYFQEEKTVKVPAMVSPMLMRRRKK